MWSSLADIDLLFDALSRIPRTIYPLPRRGVMSGLEKLTAGVKGIDIEFIWRNRMLWANGYLDPFPLPDGPEMGSFV
jgi:hypothetical protein